MIECTPTVWFKKPSHISHIIRYLYCICLSIRFEEFIVVSVPTCNLFTHVDPVFPGYFIICVMTPEQYFSGDVAFPILHYVTM